MFKKEVKDLLTEIGLLHQGMYQVQIKVYLLFKKIRPFKIRGYYENFNRIWQHCIFLNSVKFSLVEKTQVLDSVVA